MPSSSSSSSSSSSAVLPQKTFLLSLSTELIVQILKWSIADFDVVPFQILVLLASVCPQLQRIVMSAPELWIPGISLKVMPKVSSHRNMSFKFTLSKRSWNVKPDDLPLSNTPNIWIEDIADALESWFKWRSRRLKPHNPPAAIGPRESTSGQLESTVKLRLQYFNVYQCGGLQYGPRHDSWRDFWFFDSEEDSWPSDCLLALYTAVKDIRCQKLVRSAYPLRKMTA
eukprot:jgi/Hompol1/3338/HPOL_001577-RA